MTLTCFHPAFRPSPSLRSLPPELAGRHTDVSMRWLGCRPPPSRITYHCAQTPPPPPPPPSRPAPVLLNARSRPCCPSGRRSLDPPCVLGAAQTWVPASSYCHADCLLDRGPQRDGLLEREALRSARRRRRRRRTAIITAAGSKS